jgi:ribosomal protein L11 methyltransferase
MRTWPAVEIQRADPETGDRIQAFLLDFDIAAIDDNLSDVSTVFFHHAGDRDRAADGLRRQFPDISVRAIDVPDEDWAARSQASLRSVHVGALVVSPPWDAKKGSIVIQPSMGFGTGHHATTRLCLAALQQIDLRGLRVIDVGTGSGVLAIAASRLGARDVVAIDDDPDAVASARENLALNPDVCVTLTLLDLRILNPEPRIPNSESPSTALGAGRIPDQFDVVVANLTGGLLMASAARLTSLAAPSGRLVLSGLVDSEEDDVLRAFKGWNVERRGQEDEWICLELTPDRK